MASLCGLSFGRSKNTIQSKLTMLYPAPVPSYRLTQHIRRLSAAIGLVGIRKHLADIAERRRAEQGIGDRMQQHVGIAMSNRVLVMRNVDAASRSGPPASNRCVSCPIPTRMTKDRNPSLPSVSGRIKSLKASRADYIPPPAANMRADTPLAGNKLAPVRRDRYRQYLSRTLSAHSFAILCLFALQTTRPVCQPAPPLSARIINPFIASRTL